MNKVQFEQNNLKLIDSKNIRIKQMTILAMVLLM